MSRSGYEDGLEMWDLIRWRGAVASAIRGKRGQAFLRELLAALDALPQPRLIAHHLELSGDVCALGCVGRARGLDLEAIDPEDREQVARAFGIAVALVAEIAYQNDEAVFWAPGGLELRFDQVRAWVAAALVEG